MVRHYFSEMTDKQRETKKMTAKKKKTTKKKATKKKAATKEKATRKKKVQKTAVSFATFLDNHMMAGVTWSKLSKLAVVEADRRSITSQRTVAALKSHARSRGYQDQWTVKMDDKVVKMTSMAAINIGQEATFSSSPRKYWIILANLAVLVLIALVLLYRHRYSSGD